MSTMVAPDGKDIESQIATQLGYLSQLARHLGIADPVEEYFAPVVGRWSDMHAEAERWRLVGEGAEQVTQALTKPLGKLDAAWDGEAADSFIAYMQRVGLAGNDLADSMIAMADVLDTTANAIREIVVQLAGVLSETAETASQAMALPVQGDDRAREYLDLMRRPTNELFESVRQILEAFVRLCEGTDGGSAFRQVTMAHTFPEENWTAPRSSAPSVPVPGAPGVPSVPVDTVGSTIPDTTTDTAGFDTGGGSPGGGGPGGGGVGQPGLGGGAGAPAGPGSSTVAGEQPPRSGGAAAAAAASGGPKGPGAGMPMAPMAPMMGGQGQGGDAERKARTRVKGNPEDIFGKPAKATTPVIGADD